MPRIRLDIAYDGTEFKGWATQPGLRTVQQELETALTTVLRRDPTDPVRLTVGGRTDAGVHARGQVAHFDVAETELPQLFGRAGEQQAAAQNTGRVNGVLKRQGAHDVVVHGLAVTVPEFDARFGALWRRYEYRLTAQIADPLVRNFTAELKREPELNLLQAAAAELTGLRDFGAFCKAREGATSIRNLTDFRWRQNGAAYIAMIQADAFCHSMVRALVGACVAVATGRITLARLCEIRDAAERSSEFTVMPANGLSLEEIAYPPAAELAIRAAQTRARRGELGAERAAQAAQDARATTGLETALDLPLSCEP